MDEQPTTVEMLMAEVAANVEALVEHAMENVAQPPRGAIAEVGHYKALHDRFKRKEYEALQRLLEDFAYNVAATLFATLDGAIESDFDHFPRLAVVELGNSTPIADALLPAFQAAWAEDEEADEEHPHPD